MRNGRNKTVGRSPTARLVYSLTGVGQGEECRQCNICLYFEQLLSSSSLLPVCRGEVGQNSCFSRAARPCSDTQEILLLEKRVSLPGVLLRQMDFVLSVAQLYEKDYVHDGRGVT